MKVTKSSNNLVQWLCIINLVAITIYINREREQYNTFIALYTDKILSGLQEL